MHKLSIVVLLLALAAVSHGYGYEGRQLLQGLSRGGSRSRSRNSGSSEASVRVQTSGGRASAFAEADSRSSSRAKNQLVVYCERIYNQVKFPEYTGGPKGKYCVSAYSLIDDLVVAYGRASADAYASSTATVEVEGTGTACASSNSQSNAQARAYARIVGEAIAEARIGSLSSKADASFDIVSEILVQAFAEAWAKACVNKEGFADAYHRTHARAVGYPIATLWIWLFADVDCRNEREFVEILATGESTVQTDTSVSSSGSSSTEGGFADAGGDGISAATTPCLGRYKACCRRNVLRRGECLCRGHRRARTCAAVLEEGVENVWYIEQTQELCHC